MTPTLVAIRQLEIDGHVFRHAEEIMPGLLSPKTVNALVDQGRLKEYHPAERRSLFRLLPAFSGAKEKEQLDRQELTELTLPE